jgi:lipoprotein signal peptidase
MRLAAAVAVGVVAATVAHDALAPSRISHPRSSALLAGAVVVAAALLLLAPRAGSLAVTLGAGAAAGGALATALTGAAFAGGVPNPLAAGGLAFNLADVAIGAGELLLVVGVLRHAYRNRHRLREHV